jgi:hypothetical protein
MFAVGELGAWDEPKKDSLFDFLTPVFIFLAIIFFAWWTSLDDKRKK